MTISTYTHPVSELLTLGDVRGGRTFDYLDLGITSEHIPELSRMALDDDLQWADSDSDDVWAPLHAWRALGRLGDPAGIPALMVVIGHVDEWEDDWSSEETPRLLAMIGEPAIEPLRTFLADDSQGPWSQTAAVRALEEIAKEHPEHRDACITVLREALRRHQDRDRIANGALTSTLVTLGTVEAVKELEEAFTADVVDLSIGGDWEDAQIKLGLLKERKTPVPIGGWFADEMERNEPGSGRQMQDLSELLDRLGSDRLQMSNEDEARSAEKRRLEEQRDKRNSARANKPNRRKRSRVARRSARNDSTEYRARWTTRRARYFYLNTSKRYDYMDLSRLSTCTFPLREQPLSVALPIIAAAGYTRVDLLGRAPHFSLDTDDCSPAQVQKLAAENNLEIANLGTYVGVGFASQERAVQKAAMLDLKQTIDVAADFGARSIRVFRPNSIIDDPATIEHIVPWLQQAADYAEKKQVFMGFENHGGPLCGNPVHCRALSEKVGSYYFGVLYDPCNLMGAGVDYRSALETMKDHITHVHFKDGAVDANGFRRTMLGEGDIDFRWIMEQLDAVGYDGDIATEYELLEPAPAEGLRLWHQAYLEL